MSPDATTAQRPRTWRSIGGPAVAVAVSAGGWLRWHSPAGVSLLLVAVAALLVAVVLPRAWAPVQAGFERIGHWVAAAVTWALLVLAFALLFVPGRILLACLRRDPLHRAPDPRRMTYWEPLPPARDRASYRRQF
jgi:hypothetical protein